MISEEYIDKIELDDYIEYIKTKLSHDQIDIHHALELVSLLTKLRTMEDCLFEIDDSGTLDEAYGYIESNCNDLKIEIIDYMKYIEDNIKRANKNNKQNISLTTD